MKNLLKVGVWSCALLMAAAVYAEITVKNVVAQQRWPWNGLVDIDYEVVCDNPDADI